LSGPTPGPWVVWHDDADGAPVGIESAHWRLCCALDGADLALVAAAPDLIVVLRWLHGGDDSATRTVADFYGMGTTLAVPMPPHVRAAYDRVRAMIEKEE